MSFLGDMFGGNPKQVSVRETTSGAPAYAQPHLEAALERAEDVYQTPREYYPDQSYVDFSAPTLEALNRGEARAMAGNPLLGEAQDFTSRMMGGEFVNPAMAMMQSTAQGDFLNKGNPYLEAAMQPMLDRIQGQYSGSGRLGSGSNISAMTSSMAPIYAQNYATERANQLAAQRSIGGLSQQDLMNRSRAAAVAPGLAREDYGDIGRLAQFGAAREAKTGEALAEDMARFDFTQNEPSRRLQDYIASVRGGTMGSTQRTPMYGDQTSRAIGNIGTLASAGKDIWGMFK